MIRLELVKGGSALVAALEGEYVVLLSTSPFPPGSPLEARLGSETLRIKVRGSRRIEDDGSGHAYRVEGRFVSLTRVQRAALGG